MYRVDYANFANASPPSPKAGVVLAFGRFSAANRSTPVHRFSMRERMIALEWAQTSRRLGFSRLTIEPAAECGDGEVCEFLLIYTKDFSWATWGIGCGADGLTVWQAAWGNTVGVFQSLNAAFGVIEKLGQIA